MRIGLAQINCVLGDFEYNSAKMIEYAHRAKAEGCELLVFPELSIMGYLPNDLLERESIVDAQLKAFDQLVKKLPKDLGVLVGLMTKNDAKAGKPYFNSAAFVYNGKKPKIFSKQLLPTYDVFDEARHIENGSIADGFLEFKGKRFLVTICEDIWGWELPKHPTNYLENPLVKLKKEKVDCVLNLSASPFTFEKVKSRLQVVQATARNFKAPMVYVNMVGGQDEVIFDGGSLAVDKTGSVVTMNHRFEEDLGIFDMSKLTGTKRKISKNEIESVRQALVLGLRDYVRKTGFKKVHFGLSGGIDSAVVACLAVDAVGAENVFAVTLPGPFNESRSKALAEQQAKALGIRCLNLPIQKGYDAMIGTLHDECGEFDFGLTNENLQARLRGVFLMALSNKENSMLLTTGNKSEYATGYSTLYGDMCGGLAPIADLVKGQVYQLAHHYNREREVIPNEVITRPPSAELRPDQKDQDSLPPYDELDASVRRLVEFAKPAKSETDKWLLNLLYKTEFKRWQAPPVLKVSRHAFGRGRRLPIAHKART